VLGAGAVGSVLARLLAERGQAVVLWSRAGDLKQVPRGVRVERDLARALAAARLVLVCVRDDALVEFARHAADSAPPGRGRTVLHCSGSLDSRALEPFARRGWATGSLHPLASFPKPGTAASRRAQLAGVHCGVEGSSPAARWAARRLARELGGRPFELAAHADAKLRYHAGAALILNGVIALFDAAEAEFARAGVAAATRRAVLGAALLRQAGRLAEGGPAAALAGPAARGEAGLVAQHLRVLGRGPRAVLYRELTRALVALARQHGRLDERRARAVLARLAPRA